MTAVAKQWISRHEVVLAKAIIGVGVLAGLIAAAIGGILLILLMMAGLLGGACLLVWSLLVLLDHYGK